MGFVEKFLGAPGVLEVGGRQLKRYHVASVGQEVEPEVQEAAYAFVAELLPAPDEETPPAGFTVLHRNSQGAFIDAYSWVWGNVIECRVAAAGVPGLGCDDKDPTHFMPLARPWIGCVWELAPIGHERSAWVRHILEPDTPDLVGDLADTYREGMTGGSR
ncbi:MAG: hypothetical protein ACRDXC_05775 [Acidimicrobiales bacterium]